MANTKKNEQPAENAVEKISKPEKFNYLKITLPTGEPIDEATVRMFLVSGKAEAVTTGEIAMFLQLCQHMELNPFLKECYLIKYSEGTPAQVVVDYKVLLKCANKNQFYKGMRKGIIVERKGEVLELEGACYGSQDVIIGGWCSPEFEGRIVEKETISFKEYTTGKSKWVSSPGMMIEKCAIAKALRNRIPELNHAYIAEEFDTLNESVAPTLTPEQKAEAINSKLSENEPKPELEEVDFSDVVTDAEKSVLLEESEIIDANFEVNDSDSDATEHPPAEDEHSESLADSLISNEDRRELTRAIGGDISTLQIICKNYGYNSTKEIKVKDYDAIYQDIMDYMDGFEVKTKTQAEIPTDESPAESSDDDEDIVL